MSCSIAEWIISSASSECSRRERVTVSVPISATDSVAMPIQMVRYSVSCSRGSSSHSACATAASSDSNPVNAIVTGP